MQAPAIPATEALRIATLHELLVLDTPPESRFDIITAYASSQFNVAIALVSLVDFNRIWFKSACGLDTPEATREGSLCSHAICHDRVFEIADARRDPRFVDSPLVVGEPHIVFYAGAPLVMANGERVGTLCLIDRRPRWLDSWEREHLMALAGLVAMELQGQSAADDFARLKKTPGLN